MLAADNRLVRVIVELEQITSPADPDRLARGEHYPGGGLETLRPVGQRAEGGGRPVEGADALAHFAAADDKREAVIAHGTGSAWALERRI